MRTVAAIIASLLLSLVTFSIGAFSAILYLSTPEEASLSKNTEVVDLWTTEPTVVARNQHELEHGGSYHMSGSRSEFGSQSNAVEQKVSAYAGPEALWTNSIAEGQNQRPETLSIEHMRWCMSRYNSYRAGDGTFQPYNGKRRLCVSPYIADEVEVRHRNGGAAEEILLSAHRSLDDSNHNTSLVTADIDDHTRRCSERYKSYRSQDNTYQPYNGGPRRQCR